jgi:hypothetical protein
MSATKKKKNSIDLIIAFVLLRLSQKKFCASGPFVGKQMAVSRS